LRTEINNEGQKDDELGTMEAGKIFARALRRTLEWGRDSKQTGKKKRVGRFRGSSAFHKEKGLENLGSKRLLQNRQGKHPKKEVVSNPTKKKKKKNQVAGGSSPD